MWGSNQRGFTLLEILIAITLLAFISLGVVSITDNAISTMDRTTEVNRNNLQIETALSRFEWDFSQIYSPLYFSTLMNLNQANPYMDNGTSGNNNPTQPNSPGSSGTTGQPPSPELQMYYEQLLQRFERNEHFLGVSKEGLPVPRFYAPEKDVFEFFTSSNRRKVENTRQSHFAWVRYSLAVQEQIDQSKLVEGAKIPPGLKSLVRYFSADDPYDDKRLNIEDTQKVKGAVLLENVEALEFQYWNQERKKWETSLRTIPQGESVIRGVKLLITWYDYSGNKRTVERIYRTNWPMAMPQDPNTPTNNNAGGVNSGVSSGVNSGANSGASSGVNSGATAGMNSGADGGTTSGSTGGASGF